VDPQWAPLGEGFVRCRHEPHTRLSQGKKVAVQHVFVEPLGQDDNLGDSVLRAAYMEALRGSGRQLHFQLEGQTTDYLSGLSLRHSDALYSSRKAWLQEIQRARRPIIVLNAGEWTMRNGGAFPNAQRSGEMRAAYRRGGTVIAAGLGTQNPTVAATADYSPQLLEASVVAWRDAPSRDAAGFGQVAPDWAYSLGAPSGDWLPPESRSLLAVTLRFDRPWPDDGWLNAVVDLAAQTGTRVVTVAQVARDAPRAVRLAEALGGEYLVAKSTSHADMDVHVRTVYGRSLAVISDRAHALIIGATEGAFPVGSAADPQKISRMLAVAGLEGLTGTYSDLSDASADALARVFPDLPSRIDAARADLGQLRERIDAALVAAE